MHVLPKFEYLEPRSMAEACKLLGELQTSAKIIAGGTDILVNMKKGLLAPQYLVSVAGIKGLAEVEGHDGGLFIGSHLIVERLIELDIVQKKYPLLARAAKVLGSPLVRNRATVGGNLVTARPAADLPPPLMAMGARVRLKSRRREREVSLDKFFVGPGQTVIRPDEIMTGIVLDDAPPFTGGDYLKLMHRRSLEIAIVAVASRITLDKPNGTIADAKIVLSSVAPRAIHAVKAEECLLGEKPSKKLFEKAGGIASTECTPIDDIRGGAGYRCAMVEILTRRTLTKAWQDAKGK
jgi:CO/xanthine dehydrogenase FAD-binding subunit